MLTQIEVAFDEKSASEERLRQFVADASHELRTPLTSIRGYAELLGRGGFSDEAGRHKALKRIEEEATRMGGLVEDLLLLAELDRGRPLRAEPVDLHRICTDAVDDSNAVPHAHDLTLAARPRRSWWSATTSAWPRWRTTWCATRMAHTPPGHRVVVSTGVAQSMGYIKVTDNGPGIPPGRGRPGLRPLLPGRPVALGLGHRTRAGDRAGHRRGAARDGRGGGRRRRAGPALWSRSRWPRPMAPESGLLAGCSRNRLPLRKRRCRPAHRSCTDAPGSTASRTVASLTFGLGRLGLGVGVGHDAPAGPQRERRPSASSWALRMPIIHSPSPSAPTQPTGPAQ